MKIYDSPKLIEKSKLGKPYSQQPGRQAGKGAGHKELNAISRSKKDIK